MKKKLMLLGAFCALIVHVCGCSGETQGTGGESSGGSSGGVGGEGGTTLTTTTASTSSSSTSSDTGLVLGPPEACSGATSIAPGTGQQGYHQEGAFACRRFVPPAGHPHLVSWSPAVGLTASCGSLPSAASFIAAVDQAWPIDATDPTYLYTETPITEDNTEPVIAADVDIPNGSAFYGCLRLTVDATGASCTTASTCPDASDPALADMLFSVTKPDKTIDAYPTINLAELGVSPDPVLAMTLGNDRRAWNTTATFE
jgi:hypothetical protein